MEGTFHRRSCASVSRVLYPEQVGVFVIYLGSTSQWTSIDLPTGSLPCDKAERVAPSPVYMVFQPMGFTKLPMSPPALVGSYPTFSPLPGIAPGRFSFLRHFP